MIRAGLSALLAGALLVAQPPPVKSGIDLSTLDRSVRPQDDLYRFANGGWLARTTIPADRVTYGTFIELADRAELDVRRIIEKLGGTGSHEKQIRDLYRSVVDEDQIEALGARPILDQLNRIEAVDSLKGLSREAGHLSKLGAGGPFGATVGVDAKNPAAVVATVSQGGTLLPEREYYFAEDAASRSIREHYVKYLTTIFTLVHRRSAAADARAVLAFETALARAQVSGAEARARPSARALTLAEMRREMPGFDWMEWAKPQGLQLVSTLVLEPPEFFSAFAAATQTTPLSTLKAWLAARYITASSIYVNRAFADARFEFFGRVLSGQELPRERWKRGVSMVNACLGDAIGQLYVREHFPESSRRRVRGIVRNIVDAFRDAVDQSEWMTPEARRAARTKLERLQPAVGYPDRWRSYAGLQIRPDDLLGNAQRSRQFEGEYQMSRLQRPTEPGQWLIAPQTTNAHYTPSRNEIILPAAILQPPMFDPDAEDAVNYGAIGAIVGHEISHAFDQRGRRFDAFGRVVDWWTRRDEEQFQLRAAAVAEQFGRYSPLPGLHVNGQLTLIENIGDLSGVAVALRAYKRSLAGKASPALDGFSGEQRLLIRWAQIWRTRTREEYVRQTLNVSPHAPPEFRANGPIVNLDAFHDAFTVQPGDKLYLDPKKRVRIW